MKSIFKIKTNQKLRSFGPSSLRASGFTLIEIMVAVSIFAMVMVVAIGAVLAVVAANKKAAALNSVITNLNFAIEGMVRDLRTGTNYNCGSSVAGHNDCAELGNDKVGFSSAQYRKSVGYGFGGADHPTCPKGIYKIINNTDVYCLTGPDIEVNQLKFYVIGSTAVLGGDYRQPKIIVVINGNFVGYGALGDFSLQSMVSQRKLDI